MEIKGNKQDRGDKNDVAKRIKNICQYTTMTGIKSFEYLTMGNDYSESYIGLVCIGEGYIKGCNEITSQLLMKLPENGRISLSRSVDLIDYILLGSPPGFITHINLYWKRGIPDDSVDKKVQWMSEPTGYEDVLIDQIKVNGPGKYRFFGGSVPTKALAYYSLEMEIVYSDKFKTLQEHTTIGIGYTYLETTIHDKIIKMTKNYGLI